MSFYVLCWRDGYQTEAHALHLLPDIKEPHVAILCQAFFSLGQVQSTTQICHPLYMPVFDFLIIWKLESRCLQAEFWHWKILFDIIYHIGHPLYAISIGPRKSSHISTGAPFLHLRHITINPPDGI